MASTACRLCPTCCATYFISTPEYGLTIRNRFCSRWERIARPKESSIRDNSQQWKEEKREARTVFVGLLEIGQVPVLVNPSDGPYTLYLPQRRILDRPIFAIPVPNNRLARFSITLHNNIHFSASSAPFLSSFPLRILQRNRSMQHAGRRIGGRVGHASEEGSRSSRQLFVMTLRLPGSEEW